MLGGFTATPTNFHSFVVRAACFGSVKPGWSVGEGRLEGTQAREPVAVDAADPFDEGAKRGPRVRVGPGLEAIKGIDSRSKHCLNALFQSVTVEVKGTSLEVIIIFPQP